MNREIKTDIVKVNRLKKDGTLDRGLIEDIVSLLSKGGIVALPVDCMYGLVAVVDEKIEKNLLKIAPDPDERTLLVSCYKMIEQFANLGKTEYDFLHRVWPGEVTVVIQSKNGASGLYRMPRSKYVIEIIEALDRPLVYYPLAVSEKIIFKEGAILKSLQGKTEMILIVKEFCKDHVPPTVADISSGAIKIIKEGRINAEEIKSLYFLDIK